MKSTARPKLLADLAILPLTPELWPALEDLFHTKGPCSRCWCMYWRLGAAYRKRPAASNKHSFQRIVEAGPPPGLLALCAGQAVGWCQLTVRSELPFLEKSWKLPSAGSEIWSLSCFFIRIGFRRRGITKMLLKAALTQAKAAGVAALEAYPLDAAKSPSSSGTGFLTTFQGAGFKVAAYHSPSRPVMRYDFK